VFPTQTASGKAFVSERLANLLECWVICVGVPSGADLAHSVSLSTWLDLPVARILMGGESNSELSGPGTTNDPNCRANSGKPMMLCSWKLSPPNFSLCEEFDLVASLRWCSQAQQGPFALTGRSHFWKESDLGGDSQSRREGCQRHQQR
jgi:hypothetical protein